ncbi:hypothetical protein Dda_1681 [Drechslerella dactyloides]|uniref:Glutathione synthetase ATP-binding domain-like protein n=1 Tax=Drechslerella dactyloides TaxID=74499 RepID=A0AAD6J2X4_DREDA|nr:hypothetical protein Dda_1681 [Drechslerella dactyloides]
MFSQRILFLKTLDKPIASESPSNAFLLSTLCSDGFTVDERSWLVPDPQAGPLTLATLKTYDIVTFITCYEYHRHFDEFLSFVQNTIIPARDAGVRVVNAPEIIAWNAQKTYLQDLQRELSIVIPETVFIDVDCQTDGDVPTGHIDTLTALLADGSVVVKPSVSASATETFRLTSSHSPSDIAATFDRVYTYTQALSRSAKVMLQRYEPAIQQGEYSLVFLRGAYSHTMLKMPKSGDYRALEDFGARVRVLEENDVPVTGRKVGEKVMEYVKNRFGEVLGYLRVDGVVRDSGEFVLIEAEMLEPWVYFDTEVCKREKRVVSWLGVEI